MSKQRPWILFTAALLLAAGTLGAVSAKKGRPLGDGTAESFERPDATKIRSEVRQVLSQPEYSLEKQGPSWLFRWLSDWLPDETDVPEGIGVVLSWLLIIWCVLALVAILIHIGYRLTIFLQDTRIGRWVRAGGASGGEAETEEPTYEELDERRRHMAEQGDFRRALRLAVLALLVRLDSAGVVSYHDSKTNGDYLREMPEDFALSPRITDLLRKADRKLYGAASCGSSAYAKLDSTYRDIMRYIDERQ